MLIKHSLATAIAGLKTHRSRSALTILGIVIGISAIILVTAVGRGAQDLILNQIRGLGSQTIDIEPGSEPQGPSDFAQFFTDSLTEKDVAALRNPANVQGLTQVAPGVARAMSVAYGNESVRATIMGGTELTAQVLDMAPAEGAFFSEEDIRQRASVAVIGAKVKTDLFGDANALGERIKIKGKPFRVAGVAAPKGQAAIFNADETVIVPYTTAQEYLLGINYFNFIFARAASEEIVPRVVKQIEATLREQHGITDPDKDDFHVHTQADAAERVKTVTGILTALLGSVAGISLLVGGIGIMNIMLVSVTERTREIGLRKALGATDSDILQQFLIESVILTAVGGVIGIIFGALLSLIAALILSRLVGIGWQFSFPLSAALLGLLIAAAVGLVFGLYPARQAARKSPIEALRYE